MVYVNNDGSVTANAANPPKNDTPDKALVERLREALVSHNDALRSAQQIAHRDGRDTNWLAFRGLAMMTLAEHHETVNSARAALNRKGEDDK